MVKNRSKTCNNYFKFLRMYMSYFQTTSLIRKNAPSLLLPLSLLSQSSSSTTTRLLSSSSTSSGYSICCYFPISSVSHHHLLLLTNWPTNFIFFITFLYMFPCDFCCPPDLSLLEISIWYWIFKVIHFHSTAKSYQHRSHIN